MKKLIRLKLKIFAKLILAKYKPEVIGITGSVGKTGAREAVYSVLRSKFNVRRSAKNYNNEVGVPLTIIGSKISPGKSFLGWTGIFLKALWTILIRDKNYPKILILEMGVDRPGDMEYLNSIVRPKIGVVTNIGESHLQFFDSLESIQKEKAQLIENLAESGYAVLNYDDERVRKISETIKSKIITYGFSDGADVKAQEARIGNVLGVDFKLTYKDSSVLVHLPEILGRTAIEEALVGVAIGLIYNFSLVDISKSLEKFRAPKGRMNLIAGIKNTFIIDDSYNSSPQSSVAALYAMSRISLAPGARRFAVLGDMLELGRFTEEGHRAVGRMVAKLKIDKLITVGEKSRDIAVGAEENGMKKDDIFSFPSADDARLFVQERIEKGDLILIKGSQNMRMEKIVKEIMADPLHAKELLVRQDDEWEK